MLNKSALFHIVLIFSSSCATLIKRDQCKHDNLNFRCVSYLKNYDGDTITFNIPNVPDLIGNNISVRIKNIDTPEMRGSTTCERDDAARAQSLIQSVLQNSRKIDLENVERDKYFRILADVVVDGVNLRNKLLENKLAVTYNGGTKQAWKCSY